jgi:hypothetical protein
MFVLKVTLRAGRAVAFTLAREFWHHAAPCRLAIIGSSFIGFESKPRTGGI